MQLQVLGLKEAQRLVKNLGKDLPKVVARATNATLKTTKVQAAKALGKELNLPAKSIKRDISTDKARFTYLQGAVNVRSRPPGLMKFYGTKAPLGGAGVTYKKFRGGAREKKPGAFIAFSNNSWNVYIREWRRENPVKKKRKEYRHFRNWHAASQQSAGAINYRLGIDRLTGPRVSSILAQAKIIKPLLADGRATYVKNIKKEIDAVMRGY